MTRLLPLLPLLLAACGAPPAPVATPSPEAVLPDDVRWVGTSAEYRAIVLQTYRAATDAVRRPISTWITATLPPPPGGHPAAGR